MGISSHLALRRLVGAYADGELDPGRVRRMQQHVRECWECSGQLELLRLIRAALRRHRRRQPTELSLRRLERLARLPTDA